MPVIDDSEADSSTSLRARLIAAGTIIPLRDQAPDGDPLAASLEGRPCLLLDDLARRATPHRWYGVVG